MVKVGKWPRPDPWAASHFPEVDKLQQRWREAPTRRRLPSFEDLAVGQLGWVAEDLVLLRSRESRLEILRSGDRVCDLLFAGQAVALVSEISAITLRDAIARVVDDAIRAASPVFSTAVNVRDGLVGTLEFLALPMEWKDGHLYLLVYARERHERANLLDAVYNSTGEGLIVLSPGQTARGDFQILSLNASAAQIFGRQADEMLWKSLSDVVPPAAVDEILMALTEVVRSRKAAQMEFSVATRTDRRLHLHVSMAPLGQLIGVTLSDITRIREREESERLLFDGNPLPLIIYDPVDSQILRFNSAAVHCYGYAPQTMRRMTTAKLVDPDERDQGAGGVEAGGWSGGERNARHITAQGRRLDVIVYVRELLFDGRSCRLASIVDITEQRKAEARIQHMALHDSLTNLANRTLLRAQIDDAFAALPAGSRSFAVLCIDLDNFKHVNDSLGHPSGDALLKVVARRLVSATRDGDVVARFGGDEFAILQRNVDSANVADELARRLIDAVAEPCEIDGHKVHVGASVGVAIAPKDGDNADDLIKNADIAMYRAKSEGKGGSRFFESGMQSQSVRRLALESEMRSALGAREFEVHYQPLIDVASGRIVTCEALLRWNRGGRMVPPSEFIPIAEETGLMAPLGDWVLRRACEDAASWPMGVKVAVNLSPMQFRGGHILDSVQSALFDSGLDAARLELEITESLILEDNEANISFLRALRSSGVSVVMDDFGRGYSSLHYLRAFPFDKIKIDRSFTSELGHDANCLAIIRAVAALAESLKIATVIEGVETAEQFRIAKSEGLTQAQGFLFSKALPLVALKWMLGEDPKKIDAFDVGRRKFGHLPHPADTEGAATRAPFRRSSATRYS